MISSLASWVLMTWICHRSDIKTESRVSASDGCLVKLCVAMYCLERANSTKWATISPHHANTEHDRYQMNTHAGYQSVSNKYTWGIQIASKSVHLQPLPPESIPLLIRITHSTCLIQRRTKRPYRQRPHRITGNNMPLPTPPLPATPLRPLIMIRLAHTPPFQIKTHPRKRLRRALLERLARIMP